MNRHFFTPAHFSSCATKRRAELGQWWFARAAAYPLAPCAHRSFGSLFSDRAARATASASCQGTTTPLLYRSTSSTARGDGVVITGMPCAMYSTILVGIEWR